MLGTASAYWQAYEALTPRDILGRLECRIEGSCQAPKQQSRVQTTYMKYAERAIIEEGHLGLTCGSKYCCPNLPNTHPEISPNTCQTPLYRRRWS